MKKANHLIQKAYPNCTQGEIAEQLGISRTYLNQILSEKRAPSRQTIDLIQDRSGGMVPAQSWFETADAPEVTS